MFILDQYIDWPYLALHSRAAMLTGAHAALRLLISLL